MKKVDDLITDVIRREGGYVNHPADKGGPTKYGITHKTLTAWRGRAVGADDVRALTEDEAREIYAALYFIRQKLSRLPAYVQGQVFDIAANLGPKRAVILFQQTLNRLGLGPVTVDGLIGPQTINAVYSSTIYAERNPILSNALVDARIAFYRGLVAADPTQQVFLKGWLRRAEEFRETV